MELGNFLVIIFCALSIRFFIFDFYLFRSYRESLKDDHWIWNKLFQCPFCQGFWSTLIVYPWIVENGSLIQLPFVMFAGAYISLLLAVFIDTHIDKWELKKEKDEEEKDINNS